MQVQVCISDILSSRLKFKAKTLSRSQGKANKKDNWFSFSGQTNSDHVHFLTFPARF
jgi:hypothetical protein